MEIDKLFLQVKDKNKIDFDELYQTVYKQKEKPLGFKNFTVEGSLDFCCVLFLPKSPLPAEHPGLYFFGDEKLMSEKYETILPEEFNFIVGIINFEDYPFEKVETRMKLDKMIKKFVSKYIITLLEENSGSEEFQKEYSVPLRKFLLHGEMPQLSERVVNILRFPTTFNRYISFGEHDSDVVCYSLDEEEAKKYSKEENVEVFIFTALDEHLEDTFESITKKKIKNI